MVATGVGGRQSRVHPALGSLIASQGPHSPPSPAASPPPGACRPGGPEGAGSAAGARASRGASRSRFCLSGADSCTSASSSRCGGKPPASPPPVSEPKSGGSASCWLQPNRTVWDLAFRFCRVRAALPAAGTVSGLVQPSPWGPTSGWAQGPGRGRRGPWGVLCGCCGLKCPTAS